MKNRLTDLWETLFSEIDSYLRANPAVAESKLNEHHSSQGSFAETVTSFFARNADQLVELFLESHGNRLAFYDADGIAGTVACKALLYADASVFVSRQKTEDNVSYWLNDVDADQITDHRPGPLSIEFYNDLRALRPMLLSGLAILLPSHSGRKVKHPDTDTSPAIGWATRDLERLHDDVAVDVVRRLNRDPPTVRLEATQKGVMQVLASAPAVRAQLLEDTSVSPTSVHIRLPNLSGVSLESLLRLREENEDALVNLRHALRRFYVTDPADSRAFLDMMDEVDHGVRAVADAFEATRRKRLWESMGLVMGGVGLVSLYVLSSDVGRMVSQVLGATSAAGVLNHVASGKWSTRHVHKGDFYYAWHAGKQPPRP